MLQIQIIDVDVHVDDGDTHNIIPVSAIASWAELLNIDYATAMSLILHHNDVEGSGDRNVWTGAYEQLVKDALSVRRQVSAALIRPLSPSGALVENGAAASFNLLYSGVENTDEINDFVESISDDLDKAKEEFRSEVLGDLA